MPTPPYSPCRIEISIPKPSYDGLYWGRYPNGDKPTGAAGAAAIAGAASGTLTSKVQLQGAATVASAVAGNLSGGSSSLKKWHPGWYGDFNTVINNGGTVSKITFETDLVGSSPAGMLGYLVAITWGAYETAKGVYNRALLDSIYNKLTSYPIPRRMSLVIQVGAFTSTHPGTNDSSILPLYLQQDPATYGQAGYRVGGTTTTVSGASGWYGGDGNGNTYAAQLHRASVNNRFIAMVQDIAAWGDSKPMFEAFVFQENSFWIGANATNGGGPGYSDTLATQTQTTLITAAVAAFQQTNVAYENTFMNTVTPCQTLETTLIQAGSMPAQTDTRGQTFINNNGGTLPTWGMAAYGGVQLSGSTATVRDWRPLGVHSHCQIEAPDLGAFGGVSGGTVPITFTAAPASGATSAVISSPAHWPNGTGYMVRFSNGTSRSCTVADNRTFTWTGGVGAGITAAAGCLQGGANGWTPQDIADAMNGSLDCSHAYLVVIPSSATYVAADRRWPQASATVLANPIINTSYPTNYP